MTNVFCKKEKESLALTAENNFFSLFPLNTISVSIGNVLLCSIYAYLRTVTGIHICLCCRNYLRKIRHLESDGQIQRPIASASTTRPGTAVEMDRTNIPATPKDILSFAWQISKGMAYLSDIKVSKPALLTLSMHSCQERSQKCDKRLCVPSGLFECLSVHTYGTSRLPQDRFL
jgi:hypothetical protein